MGSRPSPHTPRRVGGSGETEKGLSSIRDKSLGRKNLAPTFFVQAIHRKKIPSIRVSLFLLLCAIFNLPRYHDMPLKFCYRCQNMSYIGNGWCQTCGHRSRLWRGHRSWGARKAAGMGRNRDQRRDAHGRQGRRGGEERRDKPPAPSSPTGAAPTGTPPPSPEVVIVETPGHRVV